MVLAQILCAGVLLLWASSIPAEQKAAERAQQAGGNYTPTGGSQSQDSGQASATAAAESLRQGTKLTMQGQFAAAIPLLHAAQTGGASGYAAGFNLALCYVGTGRYVDAITQLQALQGMGRNTAAVNNLMAQAYLGKGDLQQAWASIQEAARLAPTDEKMYALLLNACTDHYAYALGLQVADLGLTALLDSARLHYERAMFLARLDRFDEAKPEFAKAAQLDPGGDVGYLALVQERLYQDRLPEALDLARRAVNAGHRDYQMLSLLGTVLMFSGAAPASPEFAEARSALEASVSERGDYSTSQIALGKLYLMEGRAAEAIPHLEAGRRLEPQNPAVYTSLASAYRRIGDKQASEASLSTLAALLREKAATAAREQVQP